MITRPRKVLSRVAIKVRNSRLWPWVRPAYALAAPFCDLGALSLNTGDTPNASKLPRARDRGSPPVSGHVCTPETAVADPHVDAVLYRIIGNDLWPRHKIGQSRENVEWILQHEPDLPHCEKRWVVNRLIDSDEERKILSLLDSAKQPYVHIPFLWDEYRRIGWDIEGVPPAYVPGTRGFHGLPELMRGRVLMRLYRHKNNYVMNNNGARNAAIEDGISRKKWVLPWDGNCFLTLDAWRQILKSLGENAEKLYHVVPMARLTNNQDVLIENFQPEATEEPQVIFRWDARERFNEAFFYGRRPKVELLWRLGVSGPWDDWRREPWDLDFPEFSSEAGCFSTGGWVARLSSGQAQHEVSRRNKAFQSRGLARIEAIHGMLRNLDESAFDAAQDRMCVKVVSAKGAMAMHGANGLGESLRDAAEAAMNRGPYSVVDKTTLPPSKKLNDYWHPAPYYWPHPLRIPGLPYVVRDGERAPGTRLYEPESERYDRTRVQRLFDDTWILSLAYHEAQEERFGAHAVRLLRRWFIGSETAMNPHLQYAQVRRGHNKNLGAHSGIIEFKDFYYFLDGVRLLSFGGALKERDRTEFEHWLGRYLHWLRCSDQGVAERATQNNHGIYYDLQVASIAAFLGEWRLLRETLRDSRSRILDQFASDGRLPDELRRTTSAHYACFTMQGWIHLARLAESVGEDIWSFEGPEGQSLKRGMEWLLAHVGKPWPYEQINHFDRDRFYPILFAYRDKFGTIPIDASVPDSPVEVKPIFHPHDGIMPFWQSSLTA